jgi:hypothetical protein
VVSSPTDFLESNSGEFYSFPASTRTTLDPASDWYELAPAADLQEVQDCHERCAGLVDLIRAIHAHLNERETLITKTLNEMWAQNPDLRRRGLVGGIARKQRLKMPYLPIDKAPAEQKERRKDVEEKDYVGRTQLEGIRALRLNFEEGFHHLRRMLSNCNLLVQLSDEIDVGVATEDEARRA